MLFSIILGIINETLYLNFITKIRENVKHHDQFWDNEILSSLILKP